MLTAHLNNIKHAGNVIFIKKTKDCRTFIMRIPLDKPTVKRPWGGYTILKKTNHFWIKKLYIEKNRRLSLQNHQLRDEVWVIEKGRIKIQIGNKTYLAKKGDIAFVPKKTKHHASGETWCHSFNN